MNSEYKRKVNLFVAGLAGFYFLIFILTYDAELTIYNSSLLGFSYEYGFIPRAFIGTIYHFIDLILPIDMYSYGLAMRFVEVTTALFFVLMLAVARKTLLMVTEEKFRLLGIMWIVYGILFVSMFSSKYNFGRVDLFMLIIDVIGVILLLYKRCEWLIIPLSVVGVLIHEGFVFMYFAVLLVMLFYRFVMTEEKLKYGLIFVLSFGAASAMFLYIHFVRTPVDASTYMEIYRQGRRLSSIDMPHVSLLSAELLCVNLADIEKVFHRENLLQLPIFLILMLPYLIFVGRLFKKMQKKSDGPEKKLLAFAIMFGWITLLPNYLLKVDYGRWLFATFSYLLLIFITMIADGNKILTDALNDEIEAINKHNGVGVLLMIYPIIMVPFMDVYINDMLKRIADMLNVYLNLY